MVKVLFFTQGTEVLASSRTRVYQYLPFLKREGFAFKVIPYNTTAQIRRSLSPPQNRFIKKVFLLAAKISHFLWILKALFHSRFYDILFIQKVLPPIWFQRMLHMLNKKIIFDFDDSTLFLKNDPMWVRYMLQASKLIIIENEYTGEYAGRFNPDLLFITGPIDTEHYFMRSEKKGRNEVVIGWIGHPEHRGYILALTHIFKSLCKKYPEIRIMTIGAGDITMEGVNLITKNWSLETEIDNLHQFDIGIMPLPDDDVARGKGGYKLLQYMALGIPCVASPVGINSTMVKEGENGFLARTDNEWLEKISLLIEDKELRHKMGTIGRKIAVEEYSFSVAAPKLIRALRDVIGKR